MRDQKLERQSRQAKPKSVVNSVVVVQNAPKMNKNTLSKPQLRKGIVDQGKKESKRAIGNRYGNNLRLSLEEKTVEGLVVKEEVNQKPMMLKKQNSHNLSQPSLHVVESKFLF